MSNTTISTATATAAMLPAEGPVCGSLLWACPALGPSRPGGRASRLGASRASFLTLGHCGNQKVRCFFFFSWRIPLGVVWCILAISVRIQCCIVWNLHELWDEQLSCAGRFDRQWFKLELSVPPMSGQSCRRSLPPGHKFLACDSDKARHACHPNPIIASLLQSDAACLHAFVVVEDLVHPAGRPWSALHVARFVRQPAATGTNEDMCPPQLGWLCAPGNHGNTGRRNVRTASGCLAHANIPLVPTKTLLHLFVTCTIRRINSIGSPLHK